MRQREAIFLRAQLPQHSPPCEIESLAIAMEPSGSIDGLAVVVEASVEDDDLQVALRSLVAKAEKRAALRLTSLSYSERRGKSWRRSVT